MTTQSSNGKPAIVLAWPEDLAAHMREWHGCGEDGHGIVEECCTEPSHDTGHEHANDIDIANGEGAWPGYREHQHEVTP